MLGEHKRLVHKCHSNSRRVLHHSASLNLHSLQYVMLVEPLDRVWAKYGQVVLQRLVLRGKMLRQRGTGAW